MAGAIGSRPIEESPRTNSHPISKRSDFVIVSTKAQKKETLKTTLKTAL